MKGQMPRWVEVGHLVGCVHVEFWGRRSAVVNVRRRKSQREIAEELGKRNPVRGESVDDGKQG